MSNRYINSLTPEYRLMLNELIEHTDSQPYNKEQEIIWLRGSHSNLIDEVIRLIKYLDEKQLLVDYQLSRTR